MATLGATALTYMDWAKRVEDNYKIGMIIEILSLTNEILLDMLTVEGNLPTGHKTVIRTGLPSATWRLLNYGVQPSKSTTAPIVDTCGNLEAFAEVDVDIAKLNGQTAEFRLSESIAFLQAMNQEMAATLFYGNIAVTPERFQGLAPRYNSLTGSATGAQIVDMLGTGSTNTSIWIVTWGERTTHGIFPKGSTAGLQHRDMGEWPKEVASGTYMILRDHFKWELGLTVRDWRYNVRLANIDVTLLNGASAANIINGLVRGLWRLPTTSPMQTNVQTSDAPTVSGMMGRTVIYCNRVVGTYLDLQAMNKTNTLLQLREYDGMVVNTFRGIPIRICDAILNTEARIV